MNLKIEPFKLERYFAKYEFNVPYLLCTSDCESFSVKEILDLEPSSIEEFQDLWLGYTESQGHPDLKKEIAELYSQISPEDVLVHAGAEEAIFNFMNIALKPGDHVIVHVPCYQSLFEVARSIGCEITEWETKEEDNWDLDINFLMNSIRKNTKAIVINCPHNPTGYLMDRQKMNEIIEIARDKNVIILSDEVYRFLEYEEADRLPSVSDLYENGVSLGVMSKAFGLAGLRIGWIVTKNRDIYQEMASFKDYTSICSSAPSEFLSIIALKNREQVLQRNREIILKNLGVLNQFFSRHTDIFNWQPPKAGCIAFPSIKIDKHIEEFCHDLIEKKGVLLLPGNYYDFGDKNFRIGFGRKNMPECIEKFEEYISENY